MHLKRNNAADLTQRFEKETLLMFRKGFQDENTFVNRYEAFQ